MYTRHARYALQQEAGAKSLPNLAPRDLQLPHPDPWRVRPPPRVQALPQVQDPPFLLAALLLVRFHTHDQLLVHHCPPYLTSPLTFLKLVGLLDGTGRRRLGLLQRRLLL